MANGTDTLTDDVTAQLKRMAEAAAAWFKDEPGPVIVDDVHVLFRCGVREIVVRGGTGKLVVREGAGDVVSH